MARVRGLLLVFVLVQLSLVLAAPPPSKPSISLLFTTDVTLSATTPEGEKLTAALQWIENGDAVNASYIFQSSSESLGFKYPVFVATGYTTVNFDPSSQVCEIGCDAGVCCTGESPFVEILMTKEMASRRSDDPSPPPQPPQQNSTCRCVVLSPFFALLKFYEDSQYSGACQTNSSNPGTAWNTFLSYSDETLNFTLCYDTVLDAPSWVFVNSTTNHQESFFPGLAATVLPPPNSGNGTSSSSANFVANFEFSNWVSTTPPVSAFEIPSYCQCSTSQRRV